MTLGSEGKRTCFSKTQVTFKLEKNRFPPPKSHPFPFWVQQHRCNRAFIKSPGQPKSGTTICVRRHSEPSSKMPCAFFFNMAGFLQSLHDEIMKLVDCPQGIFDSIIQERNKCGSEGTRPCAYTVPGSCREHGSPSQSCRVSL